MPADADFIRDFISDTVAPLGAQAPIRAFDFPRPDSLEGVLDGILAVGSAAGREEPALRAVVALRERLDRAAGFVNPFADGPPGIVLTGLSPLTVGGWWIPQLVERAGATHPSNPTCPTPGSGAAAGPQMAQRLAGPPRAVDPAEIAKLDPAWVVICPEGMELGDAVHGAAALALEPWFSGTRAARGGRVAVLDGTCTLHRPARAVAECFEFLVGWFNDRPGLIPPGFPWRALT